MLGGGGGGGGGSAVDIVMVVHGVHCVAMLVCGHLNVQHLYVPGGVSVYATNGTARWDINDGKNFLRIGSTGGPALSPCENFVYFLGSSLYAVHTSNGTVAWQVKASSTSTNSPTVDSEGNMYVQSCGVGAPWAWCTRPCSAVAGFRAFRQ